MTGSAGVHLVREEEAIGEEEEEEPLGRTRAGREAVDMLVVV